MKNANLVSREMLLVVIGVVGLMTGGCAKSEPEVPAQPKTVKDWFEISVDDRVITMQLALSSGEMQQGLMGRRDLQATQGMLFVYPYPTVMGFWMKNTPTALDIGFFTSDGILREIYPLHPFDERSVRSRRDDLMYALEVVQGGFAEMGIKPGAQLDLDALRAAMIERGYEPDNYRGLAAPR
jgi:uncharacterized membrane protein (UPF0127 family)